MRLLQRYNVPWLILGIFCAVGSRTALAADETAPAADEVRRAETLQEMKLQAAAYNLTLVDDAQSKLTLHDEPLLRFSNPVGGVPDGIAVMWKDGQRPAVFAQVFQTKEGLWVHECQSLAGAGLKMEAGEKVLWQPKEAADPFRKLDGAEPAKIASRRLAQMRAIAEEHSAADDFKISSKDRETTRHPLRMLPRPVYRYQDAEANILDAAVFAFVHGTDPELFLTLEYRTKPANAAGWHVSFAPMTCWAVTASRNNQDTWSVPERLGKSSRDGLYHVWVHRPPPTK